MYSNQFFEDSFHSTIKSEKPLKKMWYWRPKDYKSANRKPRSMEYIRFKYGSDIIDSQENYELESGNI